MARSVSIDDVPMHGSRRCAPWVACKSNSLRGPSLANVNTRESSSQAKHLCTTGTLSPEQ